MPHVGLEPTTVRLRVVSATDCASEATSLKADSHGFPSEANANDNRIRERAHNPL